MNTTYRKYKSLGLCVKCGAIPLEGHTMCQRRNDRDHGRDMARREKEKEERRINADRSQRKRPKLTLEEINRMAKDSGVSYGTMVQILEGNIREA